MYFKEIKVKKKKCNLSSIIDGNKAIGQKATISFHWIHSFLIPLFIYLFIFPRSHKQHSQIGDRGWMGN